MVVLALPIPNLQDKKTNTARKNGRSDCCNGAYFCQICTNPLITF